MTCQTGKEGRATGAGSGTSRTNPVRLFLGLLSVVFVFCRISGAWMNSYNYGCGCIGSQYPTPDDAQFSSSSRPGRAAPAIAAGSQADVKSKNGMSAHNVLLVLVRNTPRGGSPLGPQPQPQHTEHTRCAAHADRSCNPIQNTANIEY
jgi:hypothetical protein